MNKSDIVKAVAQKLGITLTIRKRRRERALHSVGVPRIIDPKSPKGGAL